jgi:hypothetical protein
MAVKTLRLRRLLVSGAIVAGTGLGAAGIASAASGGATTTTTLPASGPMAHGGVDPGGVDPATLAHGPGETLLSGTDLADATASASAAVSGATVVRAETDSAGAALEVHMKKSDGTYVTVKEDATFKVTSVENGFGVGPAGMPPAPPRANGARD